MLALGRGGRQLWVYYSADMPPTQILTLGMQLLDAAQDTVATPCFVTANIFVVKTCELDGKAPGAKIACCGSQQGYLFLRDGGIIEIFTALEHPQYLITDGLFIPFSHRGIFPSIVY